MKFLYEKPLVLKQYKSSVVNCFSSLTRKIWIEDQGRSQIAYPLSSQQGQTQGKCGICKRRMAPSHPSVGIHKNMEPKVFIDISNMSQLKIITTHDSGTGSLLSFFLMVLLSQILPEMATIINLNPTKIFLCLPKFYRTHFTLNIAWQNTWYGKGGCEHSGSQTNCLDSHCRWEESRKLGEVNFWLSQTQRRSSHGIGGSWVTWNKGLGSYCGIKGWGY